MPEAIPEQQWAQIFDHVGGPLEYRQIPVPRPEPDEVLINVKYCGVCRTDLNLLRGEFPVASKLPLVGGHEAVGVVVARGSQVRDIDIGDSVGTKWINATCQSCEFCEQAEEQLCPKAVYTGYTVDGGFRQYTVGKAAQVTRIPKDLPLEKVAPILCAGVTAYTALKDSGLRPGQTVAIAGAAGGLGSFALQYAKAMGLDVIAIGSGDEKREMCFTLGARAFVDFKSSDDVAAEVKKATEDGLGPHAALVMATNKEAFEQAAQYVRPKGVVVAVGLPPDGYIHVPIASLVLHKQTVKGSYVGNRRDMNEALEFFRRGLIDCPVQVVGLSELRKVYDLMDSGKITGRYVLDTSK